MHGRSLAESSESTKREFEENFQLGTHKLLQAHKKNAMKMKETKKEKITCI